MHKPNKVFEQKIDIHERSRDHNSSCEQYETWFLGSLMRKNDNSNKKFKRLSNLHNRITHNDTKFDDRLQANMRVVSQLAEFFPFKWLLEITSVFRTQDTKKLGIKTISDRISSYLGYIELYLTFRGLTLLDSTLAEINDYFDIDISKNDIRTWKIKLLRLIPGVINSSLIYT